MPTEKTTVNEFLKLHNKKLLEKKKNCAVCANILAQPKKRIEMFYEAMLDRNISATTICEVLESWDIYASPGSIQSHRAGTRNYGGHMEKIMEAAGLNV